MQVAVGLRTVRGMWNSLDLDSHCGARDRGPVDLQALERGDACC